MIAVRPMEMVYDPESRVMTEVYELIASSDDFSEEDQQRRDTFWEAIILYRERDYEKALEKFSQVAESGEGREDRPLDFFVGLTQERLAHDGLESGASDAEQMKGHARLLNTL